MRDRRFNKTKLIFILIFISFLLHLGISFLVLEFGFQKRIKSFFHALSRPFEMLSVHEQMQIQEKRKQKQEILEKIFQTAKIDKKPAKLVAPKSNFGWVIFDDYEQPEKLEVPTTKSGVLVQTKLTNATEIKPQKTEQVVQKESEQKPSKMMKPDEFKQEKREQVEAKVRLAKADKDTVVLSDKQKSESAESDRDKQAKKDSLLVKERIQKIGGFQKKVSQYETVYKTKEQERKHLLRNVLKKEKQLNERQNTEFVWGAQSQEKKTLKNVIALTKGYIEKLKGESGTDLIDRNGDPDKSLSFEEMRYVSYESKINWCCQAAWKQNSTCYNLPYLEKEYKAVIEFTIDDNGNLVNSKILESSGSKEIDSAITKNLKIAAPFPPLPKHFGCKTYTTGRIVTVYIGKMGF